MQLKFSLNKFAKLDNIENYTLDIVYKLQEEYNNYLEKTKGIDVDFPEFEFNKGGSKHSGKDKT